jgi:hypothetical protein
MPAAHSSRATSDAITLLMTRVVHDSVIPQRDGLFKASQATAAVFGLVCAFMAVDGNVDNLQEWNAVAVTGRIRSGGGTVLYHRAI